MVDADAFDLLASMDMEFEANDSWTSQLTRDFEWMSKFTTLSAGTDSDPTVKWWMELLRSDTAKFRHYIENAWNNFRGREADQQHNREWLRELRRVESHSFLPTVITHADCCICYDCGKTFPSEKGWRIHRRAKHEPIDDA